MIAKSYYPKQISAFNLIKEISKLIKHQIRSKNLFLLVENKIIDNTLININSDPQQIKANSDEFAEQRPLNNQPEFCEKHIIMKVNPITTRQYN